MPLCFSAMSSIKVDDIMVPSSGPCISHHFIKNEPIYFCHVIQTFLWVNKFNHCFHCLPYKMDIHFGTLIINTFSLSPSKIIIIFLFSFDLGLVKSSTNIKNNYFYKRYNICNLFPLTLIMLWHNINNFVYLKYTNLYI